MSAILAPILLIAGLVGIVWFALTGSVPHRRTRTSGTTRVHARHGVSYLRFYGGEGIGLRGLLAGLATASLVATLAPGNGAAWWVGGFVVGAVCGVVSGAHEWGLNALGLFASVVAAAAFVDGEACLGATQSGRGIALAAAVMPFLGAVVLGHLRSGLSLSTNARHAGIKIFAIVDILRFLAAPLGVNLVGAAVTDGSPVTVGVVVLVSFAFGLAAGYAPGLTLGLLAVAIAAAELYSTVVYTTGGCSAFGDPSLLGVVATTAIGYALVRRVAARREGVVAG